MIKRMNLFQILTLVAGGFLSLYVLSLFAPGWVRQQKARQLTSYQFPPAWERILRESFPLYCYMGERARQKFEAQLQVALGTKEFFSAGSLELENKHRLLCCAPFIVFSLQEKGDFSPKMSRLLILDDEFSDDAFLKEDAHDFSLRWDEKKNRPRGVAGKKQGLISLKAKKLLLKTLQINEANALSEANLFWQYDLHIGHKKMNAAGTYLQKMAQEFYVDEEILEEVIWGLHELMCYHPEEVKKVLKKSFEDFLNYYDLSI